MTDRERLSIYEMQIHIAGMQGGRCVICGKYLTPMTTQLAHRIPQTDNNIKIYGKKIIHHEKNLRAVCSLECNKAVDIGPYYNPKYDLVLEEIRDASDD